MKIILGIWVCLGYVCINASAQSKYEQLSQGVHYDDENEPPYTPHKINYHLEPEPQSRGKPTSSEHEPRSYTALKSPYRQASYPTQPYGYHIPRVAEYHPHQDRQPGHTGYYQIQDPAYPQPQVYNTKPKYDEKTSVHPQAHEVKPSPISSPHEELQYSHESEHPDHYQPAASPETPQSSLVKRDPRLPLYFTMYEKRVIQDPTDKYGKGPWRYLTYGHGITYGSKEPGKVFEKGYGYIRALGRDHCKLPEHLCPPRDEKPFDYEGRREPYFGYRPH